MKRNPDERLRDLEREYRATGDLDALRALKRARARAGIEDPPRLQELADEHGIDEHAQERIRGLILGETKPDRQTAISPVSDVIRAIDRELYDEGTDVLTGEDLHELFLTERELDPNLTAEEVTGYGEDEEIAEYVLVWSSTYPDRIASFVPPPDAHHTLTVLLDLTVSPREIMVTSWAEWLNKKLAELLEELGPQDLEQSPAPDDYVIAMDRRGMIVVGRFDSPRRASSFRHERDAYRFIRDRMEAEQFWPNVWLEGERGGYELFVLEDAEEVLEEDDEAEEEDEEDEEDDDAVLP